MPVAATIPFKDLESWAPQGTTLAFLGEEARLHAKIHAAAIGSLADAHPELHASDWNAAVIEAGEQEIPQALKILHARHVWGVVFTLPYKSVALKTIAPAITKVQRAEEATVEDMTASIGSAEAIAERVGAVNLALWRPTGFWGLNTDGESFTRSFFDVFKTKLKARNIVILGAGAFGRAVAVEALSRGCRELWIGDRNAENAWAAVDQILPSITMRGRTHTFCLQKPSAKIPPSAIVVNTIPFGARASETAAFDLSRFDGNSIYFDTAIAVTPHVAQAEKMRLPVSLGKRLLAFQTCVHVEHLTGMRPALDRVLSLVNEAARGMK
jgi:shikimate 5-dehydrogenase